MSATIYREMPAVWDPLFRPGFYARWGRESAIISARASRAEYGEYRQLLSIKAAFGGTESYLVRNGRIGVDDDTYLILNPGYRHGSHIRSIRPVHSLAIFFEAGLADQVLRSLRQSAAAALEHPGLERSGSVEFAEHLHPHDRSVSPVLRHISRAVDGGMADGVWIDEQLQFLLARMLRIHHRTRESATLIQSVKPGTRAELRRRIGLGVNFIHTHYAGAIDLDAMAAASQLSRFHFLRTFHSVIGMTPSAYLTRKRVAVSLRLLRTRELPVAAIAEQVGFGSRATLFRQIRAVTGCSPSAARGREPGRAAGLESQPDAAYWGSST